MRKLVATLMLAVSLPACAQHHHYGNHHRGSGGSWVVPAIIGGAVVYGMTRPSQPTPVIVQTPPISVAGAPVVVPKYPGATPNMVGTVWQQDWRYDQFCNCYRQFLVQVQ
jgi:hypothetical protein